MSEQYRFFDSIDGEDERFYTADEFAEYFGVLLTSGIFNGGDNLRVVASETTTSVWVKEGYAWLKGYMYKIETEPLNLTLESADPAMNRIDRIVIRLDKSLEKRYVKAFILRGTATESPIPPPITRDENIYEISLAQIKVIAGKSFIGEAEITDERFDEKVCGIVNSLIKVDTSHLIKAFESEWQTWFDGIRTETFVPIKNLEDGFVRTTDDKIHSISNKKLCVEEGWPEAPYIQFENMKLDDEGRVYISDFYEGGNLSNNNITEKDANTGNTINDKTWVAFIFSVNEEVDFMQLKLFMSVDSHYHPTTTVIIYEANSESLPDMDKEIYTGTLRAPYPYNGSVISSDIKLDKPLEMNKEYIAVIKGSYSFTWSNLRCKATPGTIKLYESKDSGSNWIPLERTPFLEINGIKREGSVTITHPDNEEFKQHLLTNHFLISVDMIDYINSSYQVDIYDLNNNLIKQDVKRDESLFETLSSIYKGIKVKINISRAGLERPKFTNYKYIWASDISKFDGAVIPSEDIVVKQQGVMTWAHTSIRHVLSPLLSRGGRYRIKGILSSQDETGINGDFIIYENTTSGKELGKVTTSVSTGEREFSVDLDAVPPNSKIYISYKNNTITSGNQAIIKDVKVCGKLGYQKVK